MWKSVCCEVQGTGHKRMQIPCQDKTFELVHNGVHVIALSDGAGSASLSHFGAERVVRTASAFLAEHFRDCLECEDGRKVKQEIMEELRRDLVKEASTHGCAVHDLASTLLLAAVCEDKFILAHIGDGVIGYLDGGNLKVASAPDNGEFSNETTFVTSNEAAASMRLFKGELKEKSAFVLMSDGTEQSLYHKPSKTLAGIVVKLMHRTCLISGEAMKRQLEDAFTSVISQNTQDDCSIAILARPSKVLRAIDALEFEERRDLYQIPDFDRHTKKRVSRHDALIAFLENPRSLRQIAAEIRLKPKYAKRHLDRLLLLGLIQKNRDLYWKI